MSFTLPANATADIASSTASFIDGISSYVALIVGVVLAFWILESIIGVLRDTNAKDH